MPSPKTPRLARITDNQRTRNGFLIAQVVRTEDNGSHYSLRGSDMLEDGSPGDAVQILTMSGGAARRVRSGDSAAIRKEG